MSKTTVGEHMTPSPHTVGTNQTLRQAMEIMRKHHVRHLPVLEAGKLIGVLSERDVELISSLEAIDADRTSVEQAMMPEPVEVQVDAPLVDVARTMAERKIGSVVVMKGNQLAGIFTTIDALWVLIQGA
jgi:acetoin utilization protein AcuB